MGSIGYTKDELVQLRVVRGLNWEWDTQDGGEGFVGTVVENIQNSGRVKVRWDSDSGEEFIYRIGAEGAYDLRVLDNSAVGVKHPGVECRGCGQKDIAGLRWQCFDCPTPINLCTFCFTNGKHDQTHVNFRRYHRPTSDPMVVRLNNDQPRIPLKGFFPGVLARRGVNWNYDDEDGGSSLYNKPNHPIGKVVPAPTGREMTPGKVWVQWPHEVDKSYPYRVGLSGKMDLKIAKVGIGGHYQPDTLPVLVNSKPRADEKTNDVIADHPFVVGDRVKFAVGLEKLREMSMDCGLRWNAGKIKKVVNEILIIKKIDNKDNTAEVVLANLWGGFWLPFKAIRRLIPWPPVGAVVQVINESLSSGMDMAHGAMAGDFGRVKEESLDGKTVGMTFFTSNGNVTRKIPVSQLQYKHVDGSVVEKVESIRKDLAELLLSEVEKGSILSVQFLLKYFPNIIDCLSPYNERNSTALSVACQKGNVEMVKLLLKHKPSVDIADEEDDDDLFKKGEKPIHHAVIRNHPEVLRLLLGNGASPNEINGNKRTPLHLAAIHGHVECVRVLLEDDQCDLDFKDGNYYSAFQLAVTSSVQSVELFNLFHATGKLNIIEKDYWEKNLLYSAAKYNNLGAARFLLSCPEGKKLACGRDEYDETPLFIACNFGHNQIAKLLVSNVDKDKNGKPWEIDTPNEEGETPLKRVVEEFNYELIELLIGAGANLQAIDKKADTSFHYAARLYREKVTTFEGTKREETNFISWPNQETAPEIFKLYNELEMKHPDENLLPHAAIICYLVAKGGIPQNVLTFPEFKKLVGDDFLFDDEIINFFPDQLNSMSQNVGNPLQYSQPAGWSEINGVAVEAIRQNTYGSNSEVAYQFYQSNPTSFIEQDNNSSLRLGSQPSAFASDQDTRMVTAVNYSVSSISQQQPFPSSQQQSNTFHSSPFITNENIPGTEIPTRDTAQAQATNTVAATSGGDYLTPSDNNGFLPATTHVPYMHETISSEGSMSNDQPTADTSTANPAAGSTRTAEEVTCTILEKHFRKRKGGPTAEDKTSLIMIDESGRRYSQQKTNVSDIFQCTANVSTPNKPNGSKKCKGTIDVQDLAGKIEEWKTNPEKKFMFTVRNAHEEHLPSKRVGKSTETESDVPSKSNKRKKKT